jgi:formylglycine-generating enzyme required for sulfatase activity
MVNLIPKLNFMFKCLFVLTVGSLLVSCGNTNNNNASLNFSLNVKNGNAKQVAATSATDICADYGIDTINAAVLNSSGTQVGNGTWACSAHNGFIGGLPEGTGFTLSIEGLTGSTKVLQGKKEGLTLVNNSTTSAGSVTITPFSIIDKVSGMELLKVPGGTFTMGNTILNGLSDGVTHQVTVGDFYIGKYEVTEAEWVAVMGSSPPVSNNCGANCPVVALTNAEVQSFITNLNKQSGRNYRLPTEAEWEYAARSGGKKENYSGSDDINAVAWYSINSSNAIHLVGQKQANGLGLYDMSGNVSELVSDWYGIYSSTAQTNPTGPTSGYNKIARGGSYYGTATSARASARLSIYDQRNSDVGFRLAGPISISEAQYVPVPPSALSASLKYTSQINLSWTDNSSTETWFKIERKVGSAGTYTQIALVPSNTVSYTDSVLASTTYYYRIRSTNIMGDSAFTNEVTVTTLASTGVTQLPKTGQTTCYDNSYATTLCSGTGQDGETQIGVAWPSPRFVDNGDQTLTDKLTGLIWTKNANIMKTNDPSYDTDYPELDGAVKWQHALDYIKMLNTGSYLGHNDWRLPNRNELRSLNNLGQENLTTWLTSQGFTNVKTDKNYWSSTTAPLGQQSIGQRSILAWSMYMGVGSISRAQKPNDSLYIWPVRSSISASTGSLPLPKTGQTTCYDDIDAIIDCSGTGQDGDLQMGISWPAPRFVDYGDQTFTDKLTGLSWSKDASIGYLTSTWQQALDVINTRNSTSYKGHNDWRLPNRYELESLYNAEQVSTAAWLINNGFSNVEAARQWFYGYWSSSNDITQANKFYIWYVDVDSGVVSSGYKANGGAVWLVRGGQ